MNWQQTDGFLGDYLTRCYVPHNNHKIYRCKTCPISPPIFLENRAKGSMLKKNVVKAIAQYNISLTYPISPLKIPMYVGKYHSSVSKERK
jgi:hypothetical protein